MTHGDAIVIMCSNLATDEMKLGALDMLINDEYPSDYTSIRHKAMWDMLKMVYKKYKGELNGKANTERIYGKG